MNDEDFDTLSFHLRPRTAAEVVGGCLLAVACQPGAL